MAIKIFEQPEPVIEFVQREDSPEFSYEKKTGAIFIKANKSLWLWNKKIIQINGAILYDYDKYNLLLMSKNIRKYDFADKLMKYNEHVILYNTRFFPRFIKKGEIVGIAIVIPKIESHIIIRTI